jgi:hypothetical protein
MRGRTGWLLLLCALVSVPLFAQDVPPPLRDWQGWVLHDQPQRACPLLANRMPGADSYQCTWPGRLTLDADAAGGRFAMAVRVDAPAWVALPGDQRNWPQQVSANRQPATVLQREAQPMLWLPPGDYQLRGTFPWTARPARLRVPLNIGMVALTIDGVAVTQVERNAEQLTLGEAAAAQRTADALSLRVYRRLGDGLPAMLETRLQFNVTGSAREQLLGPVLPAGFVATSVAGDLPARLENDGRLRVQLRPGQWTVTLAARSVGSLGKLTLTLPAAPWPRQEVWSYQDDTDLRGTRVTGHAIDAAQAGVPGDWSELPAYALSDTAGLSIESGNRGAEGGQGDQLQLRRELWLDFDGRGLNVADHLTGELRHSQRLDVAAPWQLQRAALADQPLLISQGSGGSNGVEIRERQLDLTAGLRLPTHHGRIPSAGWQVPLESITATLHLPPGYRLLGTTGTDRAPDSWLGQWTLLDLFVVALLALLAGRLLGWPWALLAAVLLALAQQESGAPRWTLALAVALALLMRALPEGRLRVGARAGAVAMLVLAALWTLPFAATQLQYALHPQLESAARSQAIPVRYAADMEEVAANSVRKRQAEVGPVVAEMASAPSVVAHLAPPPPAPAPAAPPAPPLDSIAVTGTPVTTATQITGQAGSTALIQAGVGTPQWDVGNNYRLGWSGPVTTAQSTRLFIVPAWVVRLLRVLLVALLVALLAQVARQLLPPSMTRWHWPWRGGRRAAAASAALLVFALLPTAGHAQAMPGQELLAQLRSRLMEAPKCAPACADLAQLSLQASNDLLNMELEAHIGAPAALPLPQTDAVLQLLEVSVDGRAGAPLARRPDGQLLLRLERGVHRVSLRYRIGATDSLSIAFPLRPQRVQFSGEGWALDGVEDGRALGQSIALNRIGNVAAGQHALPAQGFPPYVRLTRRLQLGVDWTVENAVERIAPQAGGFSTSLPLLPGEHPLGDDALVKDGRISVTFNANRNVVRWTSRLDHAAQLALKAPALGDRAEVWEVHSTPLWHVAAQGVPLSASDEGLRYQPLPGETLHLALTQPAAAAGASLAFDHVRVASKTGVRVTETTLTLGARSTRGGEHAIGLPPATELLGATRDGAAVNLTVRDNKLSLPLLPGEHIYTLRLREPHGVALRTRTPTFALAAPVANINTGVQLPHDRWVLWTWGPMVGPAVLYWSQLIVLLLAAGLLARLAPTPLRFRHWLLLGLGFSAFAWSAYALVVVWLIALGLRGRHVPPERWGAVRFNLLQAGLLVLSVLAVLVLVGAVPKGLLGLPDMHVVGNGSSTFDLRWFADQSPGTLPVAGVLSVSLWWYKLAMLAWALWLANALLGWSRWAFAAWSAGGYWRQRESKTAPPPLPQAAMPSPQEPPANA